MKKTLVALGFISCLLVAFLFTQKITTAKSPESKQINDKDEKKVKSEWVYIGSDGKLVYKATPMGDRIMDFSHAGYMGGGVALPDIPVKIIVKPTGKNDETASIQAAIDSVAAMPLVNGFRGTVFLEAGDYTCSETITISESGVVLRGSGSGENGTTIKMAGGRHSAIVIGKIRDRENPINQIEEIIEQETAITDSYVPSGAISFNVENAAGFKAGDIIDIHKPVTDAWVHFMEMDNLTRDGKPQTWMRTGTNITTQRSIVQISGSKILLDVPISDSYNSKYLNPPGTRIVKVKPPELISQAGIEYLKIQAPPMEMSYQRAPYTAMRINGQDCWARDIKVEETMNSVSIGGKRITLQKVVITRTVPNLGASKPAEFAPNAGQVLLDRCSSAGDNIWHIATGGGQAGPIVILNCTFGGRGHIEGHQRWTTGMLIDNCRIPQGGIDFKNRGAMGSGHGWGMGWSVAWNCISKTYAAQQPPGAFNWLIGCSGINVPTPRPFDSGPMLPLATSDSHGNQVTPKSLYLTQLAERLGTQAVKNIGYSMDNYDIFSLEPVPLTDVPAPVIDKTFGLDVAAFKYANSSNIRGGDIAFGGERALDNDPDTYWSTDDSITNAMLEVDLEEPQIINIVELCEAKDLAQRIQEYKFEGQVDSDWKLLSQGTTIGNRKIDRFPAVTAWKVRLTIIKASAPPAISKMSLYLDKDSQSKTIKD